MFIPDSLCPCATEQMVMLNGRKALRVALHVVQFTAEGMALIGQGMLGISDRYGIPLPLLRERMKGRLYSVPPSSSLYFLFSVPELDADMHVEIPDGHWRFVSFDRLDFEIAMPA